MSAGKPVVATRVGSHPKIIDDDVTGYLVDPGNLG
jgi:glycosyltransferase involved in cell wall biosynthesis